MDWTVTIICVGVFYLGFLLGLITQRWLASRRSLFGTIRVTIDPTTNRTLYSLELDANPEVLHFEDEVIFKIVTEFDEDDDSD